MSRAEPFMASYSPAPHTASTRAVTRSKPTGRRNSWFAAMRSTKPSSDKELKVRRNSSKYSSGTPAAERMFQRIHQSAPRKGATVVRYVQASIRRDDMARAPGNGRTSALETIAVTRQVGLGRQQLQGDLGALGQSDDVRAAAVSPLADEVRDLLRRRRPS